ncbi:MAG: hypothetical protein CVV27_02595 [Candidatus Melainabacteria bacterium HGW-Melainabacteria-1]|nr:MAG: hypothetical protein CVV27_02595 [Candidatus Melainabacteria bacterium HGW-Melainabacteria-1]
MPKISKRLKTGLLGGLIYVAIKWTLLAALGSWLYTSGHSLLWLGLFPLLVLCGVAWHRLRKGAKHVEA